MLAEALGYLPLALEQAAAYIDETGLSLGGYLRLFRQQEVRVLHEGKVLGYQGSVATTWLLSLQRVEELSPAAADLLCLCAFLGPDDIPQRIIVEGAGSLPRQLASTVTDPLGLNDAIAVLRSHSLVQAGEESLSVHRLVQVVTRDRLQMADAELWAGAAVEVVDHGFPPEARHPGRWPAAEHLLAHALAAAEHAQELQSGVAAASSVLDKVGVYLHAIGRFEAARSALERARSLALVANGPEHPVLVRIGTDLGLVQLRTDASAEALETTATALEQARRLDPPLDDRQLVRTMTAFGSAQAAQRTPESLSEAVATLTQALDRAVNVLGPEHPDTLDARAALAATMVAVGDLADAQTLQEQVLAQREVVLGPEHPDTLGAAIALARTLHVLGDADRARALEESAAAASSSALSPPAERPPPPADR